MTTIYFGTNRDPHPKTKPTRFGKTFSEDGLSNLRFGKADVTGKTVKIHVADEKLVPPGTPNKESKLGSKQVFASIQEEMAANHRDTILFVHGYNVSFRESLLSGAKLSRNFDPIRGGRGANVAVFSWPSDGAMAPWVAYSSDRRDAAASGPAFARSLLKLRDYLHCLPQQEACDREIHLIVHSMGAYLLRHALQEIIRQTPAGLPRLFGQIFMMAADEDNDAFEYDFKLRDLPRLAKRVNIYFNRGDKAIYLSDATKGQSDRLGDDGPRAPFQVPAKVTQIDCTKVVGGATEHSYYTDTRAVIKDMAAAMEGLQPHEIGARTFLPDRNRYELG